MPPAFFDADDTVHFCRSHRQARLILLARADKAAL